MSEYYNKIIFGGVVKLDLSSDDVAPQDVASGKKFHDGLGAPQVGTSTKDSDTSSDTATASEILATKTAHAKGSQLTGTMPNRGAVSGTIDAVAGTYTVPQGYHDGSGTVEIDSTEQSKIISGNIKDGVQILGVTGTYTGEGVTAQAKTATPTTSTQVITPDSGYDYLSQVTVNAIPYSETPTPGGGITITIG